MIIIKRVYELRYGNEIKKGDLDYLRELTKDLNEDWIICYHLLSSMRMDPIATRLNIRQMDEIFELHKKGRSFKTIAKIYHKELKYIKKIINAKF